MRPWTWRGWGLYEGFTHLANLVLVNPGIDDAAFAAARDYLREQTGIIGASSQLPAPARVRVARRTGKGRMALRGVV